MLQNLIKPYRCVSLDFLAKEINVASEEAQKLGNLKCFETESSQSALTFVFRESLELRTRHAFSQVVSLLVQLILDEKIAARIDWHRGPVEITLRLATMSKSYVKEIVLLPEGFLQVRSGGGEKAKQFTGLQKWATA